MTRGRKTGGRDFVKGQIANPKGGPKLPEELKKARLENKQEVERVLTKYLYMNPAELAAAIEDSKKPDTKLVALDIIVISLMDRVIKYGDHTIFNFILDRLIGRVKHKIEAEVSNPFVNAIAKIPPHAIGSEIKRLQDQREIIDAEYNEIGGDENG